MAAAPRCLLIAGSLAVAEGFRTAQQQPAPLDAETDEATDAQTFKGLKHPDVHAASTIPCHANLEWAITEALNERHPMKVPPPVVPPREPIVDRVQKARVTYPAGLRWHYGAHHKSGTVLLEHFAEEQSNVMRNMPFCWLRAKNQSAWPAGCEWGARREANRIFYWTRFTERTMREVEDGQIDWSDPYHTKDPDFDPYQTMRPPLRTPLRKTQGEETPCAQSDGQGAGSNASRQLRGVHIIRDPVAMVISGYIYHLKNNEVEALRPIRNMSMEKGLLKVAKWTLEASAMEELHSYQSAPSWVMHVRFEHFTSSSDNYDKVAAALYDYMLHDIYTAKEREQLLHAAAFHDLRRHPVASSSESGGSEIVGHVADESLKEKVLKIIDKLPPRLLARLLFLRKTLGY